MKRSYLTRSSSDLLHDIGVLTTQVMDNRTLLVLARTVALLSVLTDEVTAIQKTISKQR